MYHTTVILTIKAFICALFLAFKSLNSSFAAIFDLLTYEKYRFFYFKNSAF